MIPSPLLPRAALFFSALSLLSATVYAGTASYGAARATAPAAEAGGPDFGITGDWGGLRTSLRDAGINITGSYIGESFGMMKGGIKRGVIYEGLGKAALDVKLDQLVGWQGATFHTSFLYPHGQGGSDKYVGDRAIFSNIDAYDAFRLSDLWIEQRLLEDKLSLKIGQMRSDDEFGVTDTAAFFVNSCFGCANPLPTPIPVSIYPVSALGIRARMEPIKGLYGQVAIYDGNPSSGDFRNPITGVMPRNARNGTDWAIRSSEGFLWASEIGYQRCCEDYPGAIRLGLFHHTGTFVHPAIDIAGTDKDNSNTFTYFVFVQTIWQKSSAPKEGVSAFFRAIKAQEQRSTIDYSLQGGLVYTGITSSSDKVGLAYIKNHTSRFTNPVVIANGDYESYVELSYQFPLKPYLHLQPDLQYIRHPGGSSTIPNAWVVGVRAILDF